MSSDSPQDPRSANRPSLSYRDAGVDIDAGDALVDRIVEVTERTRRPEVLSGLGGFGGLCEIPPGYRQPVLVAATDGVGTKLKLAMALNRHDTIGIDLVAMCVNDLIVCGAEPLFFLDYFATGKLDVDMAAGIVSGIGRGCEMAGCALIGGETAEMPGMYHGKDYDLAGFAVGVVEKSAIIDPSRVAMGDCLIGLAASGPHSNGYSLIRKILEVSQTPLDTRLGDISLGDALLAPTEIYVSAIRSLLDSVPVHGLAHITGGGIVENLPRVLPPAAKAVINLQSWVRPAVFDWLQQAGNVESAEMIRTFNCGIGMIVCVAASDVEPALACLRQHTRGATVIGHIEPRDTNDAAVELR